MKVLFLVDKFPTFSETFIRDQIIALLDKGVEVVIYPQDGTVNAVEAKALSGYTSYHLMEMVTNVDTYFEEHKSKRILKFLTIFIKSVWSPHFKYYIRSLSVKSYGALSKSLRLFFRVHFLLKHHIDIIHAHFGPNGNTAVIYKQLGLPIKLFVTFHGYDMRLGFIKGGLIYQNLFQYADGIIAISDYNYQHLVEFGAPKAKLIVLPNGINLNFYKPDKKIKTSPNTIHILSVGRLVEEKGFDMAIEAIENVLKNHPQFDLNYTIIGDGPQRTTLERLIDNKRLSKYIQLVGYKTSNEVKDYMLKADLFLLSSRAEALPTVLLEAQACGMVVLATDVGAVKDIVKAGHVVPPTVEEICKELVNMIGQRNHWADLSSRGIEHIRKNHNIEQQTKKLLTSYRN